MQGKTVVITGATSGIGRVAAARVAAMGARLVLVARDKARGEAEMASLRAISLGVKHSIYYADLSRLADVKRVAAEIIAAAEPRIDVLINNAGALFATRQVTTDGMELTFATNHMSYFVLTHGLRERLRASAPARIVNVLQTLTKVKNWTSTICNRQKASADSMCMAAPSSAIFFLRASLRTGGKALA